MIACGAGRHQPPTDDDLYEVRRFAALLRRLGPHVERDEQNRPIYTAEQFDALADYHDDGNPDNAELVRRLRAAARRRREAERVSPG